MFIEQDKNSVAQQIQMLYRNKNDSFLFFISFFRNKHDATEAYDCVVR